MADESVPPYQLEIDDLPTEHLHGSVAADRDGALAQKLHYYAQLQATSAVPLHCLPESGIHIYRWDQTAGPCQCRATRASTKEVQ